MTVLGSDFCGPASRFRGLFHPVHRISVHITERLVDALHEEVEKVDHVHAIGLGVSLKIRPTGITSAGARAHGWIM